MTTKSIVVGFDGSPAAQAAVRWALDEARHSGARLLLVHAFGAPTPAMPSVPGLLDWPDSRLRHETEAFIADIVAELRTANPDLTIDGEVHDGTAGAALRRLSRRARMIVLGHRGRGGFAELLLGSVGLAVSTHADCPVVVVRGDQPGRTAGQPVVVGVDQSTESDLALEYAFATAAAYGTTVVAVRAWRPPQQPAHATVHAAVIDVAAVEEAEQRLLDQAVTGWAEKYPTVPVERRLAPGSPGPALAAASADAQLVVVGSRGHGGFADVLLGSVSHHLLHHAHCPVAVIRHGATAETPAG